MTNQERRDKIKELNDRISSLNHEKIITSLRYNYLTNPYRQQIDNNEEEIKTLTQKLETVNTRIRPLFEEMRELQVRYVVEYEGEVHQNGMPTIVPSKKMLYLATLVNIDSYKETPDYRNEDVMALINELKDYIYFQEHSHFTIQHIKKSS